MNIVDFFRRRNSQLEISDELLYELVATELRDGLVKQGLWAKALSDSKWDEAHAKAKYVRFRVEQLRDDLAIQLDEAERMGRLVAPSVEAREHGLTEDQIAYLVKPIKAVRYLAKYKTTQEKVLKDIGLGKLRSVMCNEVLWVQDKPSK